MSLAVRHVLLCMHQVGDGVNAGQVVESEILVVQYHPVLALFHREVLDVGEEADGDDNLASVGELGDELAATALEVEVFYSEVGFRYLAHITQCFCLRFFLH